MNEWKNRIRWVLYEHLGDPDCESFLIQWPKSLPMPGLWTRVQETEEEVFDSGKDSRGNFYIARLRTQDFSGAKHWCESSEDPDNKLLYPHLHKDTYDRLENLNSDYFEDGGPNLDDMGLAA
jgi:hypothetical protein